MGNPLGSSAILMPGRVKEQAKEQAKRSALCWSVHLMTGQPKRAAPIALVVLAVIALGLCLFHSLWVSILPALALLFSLSEFLFPVHYTLTDQSASARHGVTLLEIRWADVRHAYLTDDGIKLSPLAARNSRFEALRGVYLRFDDHNREAVIAAVQNLRLERLPGA